MQRDHVEEEMGKVSMGECGCDDGVFAPRLDIAFAEREVFEQQSFELGILFRLCVLPGSEYGRVEGDDSPDYAHDASTGPDEVLTVGTGGE